MKTLLRHSTNWSVAIREGEELLEAAIVDCEDRASSFAQWLRASGKDAIHYKTETNLATELA